jgi:hypothetical protein
MHALSKPAISNAVMAACGATVLVSRRPFKFPPRAGWKLDSITPSGILNANYVIMVSETV